MNKENQDDNSTKEDDLTVQGEVIEALPNANFKVKVSEDHIVDAHVSGKMRMHYIKIVPGDEVTVELSEYDVNKGRIVYRE